MDPAAQEITRLIITFLGGAVGLEIVRIISGAISGSIRRRRSEVDRIAAEASEAERRLRIVTEHAHSVRVIAIQAGLPIPDFPIFPASKEPSS